VTPDPALERFSGILPLFPLPNVVLFPGHRLPLHIFEPRYRQMVSDAEHGEGLIGLVLLKQGWEKNYLGESADIHPVACLGKMRKVQRLPDGRYLMTLVGLTRVRITQELERGLPYRQARVELLPDRVRLSEVAAIRRFVDEVIEAFNTVLKTLTDLPGSLLTTQRGAPPGLLLDVLASYLPADASLKQRLLEELDVRRRGQVMLDILTELNNALSREQTARLRLFPKPSKN